MKNFYTLEYVDVENELVIDHKIMSEPEAEKLIEHMAENGINCKIYNTSNMNEHPVNSWNKVIEASSGDIRRLTSVWRYSSIPITIPENIADHTFWVILYSVMIHFEVLKQSGDEDKKSYLPNDLTSNILLKIMMKALTHDMAEAVTGDIVRPFKYSSEKLKNCIEESEEKMVNELFPEEIIRIIQLGSNEGDYVKSIVKAADFLSLFQFMRREILRGNKEINKFAKTMQEDLLKMCTNDEYPGIILNELYKQLHAQCGELLR